MRPLGCYYGAIVRIRICGSFPIALIRTSILVDLWLVSLTRFFEAIGSALRWKNIHRVDPVKIMTKWKIGTIANFSSQSPLGIGNTFEYFAPVFLVIRSRLHTP
jgi:hypothetical protein